MSADDDMPSAAQVEAAESGRATHPREPHAGGIAGRLNWLRAAVLGANDGIVSVAGIVIGVAGATTNRGPIFTAGLAGLVAGAVSMALGEYVSVSSQRDSEHAQISQEKRELASTIH
jgi:vacuolar iron transporter family protein